MLIRPALPADTPALKALTAGTGVFKEHEVEVLQEVLEGYHAREPESEHVAIVAEDEGRIVGYAYYAPDVMTDRTWSIYWIAVAKEVQARGIGSAIMRYVEDDVRRRNGRLLLLEATSLEHSEKSRRFYKKQGFAAVATVKDFYADGDDMVIFRKRLQGCDT